MTKKIKIAIIIPCFNEQDNILALYDEILAISFDNSEFCIVPVFVNDCSTDNTKQILEKHNLLHLDLPVNLGIGGAVQTGFKYAYFKGFDIAVQMDGDGQHPPKELFKLIQPILEDKADVTIGSRYLTREGFQSTFLRRLGIAYFKLLNKLLVGVEVNDSTSGYRAVNRKGMVSISEYYPDEYPEPESIILFTLKKIRIKEVSVFMRERQFGKSSIRHYKTIYYMFKVTLGIIFLYIRLKFNGKRHFA